MKLAVRTDTGLIIKATNAAEAATAKAITVSMRQAAMVAVDKGRQRITAAGFSQAFARSLVALNKPPTGYVLNPRVWIHTTVNYADVFEKGATIVGGQAKNAKGGQGGRSASPYLWLPFPNVPPNPGSGVRFGGLVHREHMTPSQYVRKIGPLITVQRNGKLPLLAAIVAGPPTKRKPSKKRLIASSRLRHSGVKQTHLVFMFYAVRSITIPPKFDASGAIEKTLDNFQIIVDKNADEEIP